ncbi:hypothetical protein KIS1582_0556 [Cytobacillus firmus]|uniref:Uncharacterized protein n=1 Tax=Cytobacillus firmus TaxID=1399 RepID=A0A800NF19_CYTFI|nr:hypothetical protein KIS1582_0556 [Cytobacillus firmus]
MKLVFWGNLGSRRISGAALPQCQALTDRFLAKLKEKDIYCLKTRIEVQADENIY